MSSRPKLMWIGSDGNSRAQQRQHHEMVVEGCRVNPAYWLQRTATRVPDAPALFEGEILVANYAEFERRAATIAQSLKSSHGVQPADRVVISMKNHTRYLELMYAIWYAGAVAVPVNAKLHERELAWIVQDAGARVLLCEAKKKAAFVGHLNTDVQMLVVDDQDYEHLSKGPRMERPHPMLGDELLWLFYTSGTTGRPKGVMISCANVQVMCGAYFADVDSVEPADCALYAAPMSHGAGLYNFMHVQRGARHVVPVSGSFDEQEIFELCKRLGRASMFAAPTMVKRMVDYAKANGCSGDGIKTVVYGGAPMYLADICDAVDVLGPRFVQIYGQGECPMAISVLSRELVADRSHPRWQQRLASVGLAQSCVMVRICDAEGGALPAGCTGEILVAGAAVMQGYWRNAEATAAALQDGWLWTGDMGCLDEQGFLMLQDRSKDMIISGGSNIYPREIEEVLLQHGSVHEVSVVGRAHAEWGEEVVAFVVLGEGQAASSDHLDQHCLEHVARFKRPREYCFVDALPKNNYGKVLKTALRERLN